MSPTKKTKTHGSSHDSRTSAHVDDDKQEPPTLAQPAQPTVPGATERRKKSALALVDPRPVNRAALCRLLETLTAGNRRAEDFTVLSVTCPEELLSPDTARDYDVEMVLLNIGAALVEERKVGAQIEQLRLGLPGVPLVLLSDCIQPRSVFEALRRGIHGYVPTTLHPSMMMQVLRLVRAGGTFVPAELVLRGIEAASPAETDEQLSECFTRRQLEVLQRLRKGMSNKAIAHELDLQETTVKVFVRQIMRKLKATNRTHAAFLASRCM